jgi:hypothetical protein
MRRGARIASARVWSTTGGSADNNSAYHEGARAGDVFFVAVRAAFLQFFLAMAVCGVLQGFLGKMGRRTLCLMVNLW